MTDQKKREREEEEDEEEDSFDIDDYYGFPEEACLPGHVRVLILQRKTDIMWGYVDIPHREGVTVKEVREEAFKRKGLVSGENCYACSGGYLGSQRLGDGHTVDSEAVLAILFYRFGGVMRFYPGEACTILREDDTDKNSTYIFCKSERLNHWNYALREYVFPPLMACAPRTYFEYKEK